MKLENREADVIETVLQLLRIHHLKTQALRSEVLNDENLNELKTQAEKLRTIAIPWIERVIMRKKFDWEGPKRGTFNIHSKMIADGEQILKSLKLYCHTVEALRIELVNPSSLKSENMKLSLKVIPWIAWAIK
jgi:hypothetical protein